MLPVGFEITIAIGERPQNYALDRAATETSITITYVTQITFIVLIYLKHLNAKLLSLL
jgi:hypothetical protein